MIAKRLRVAVVGLGIGRSHLEAFSRLPDQFEVSAVCDLDEDKARAAAAKFGVAWHTTRFSDLLASPKLEVIDICTPPYTHRMLIEQALAAGFHVICEKPLLGSLADADAIAAAELPWVHRGWRVHIRQSPFEPSARQRGGSIVESTALTL